MPEAIIKKRLAKAWRGIEKLTLQRSEALPDGILGECGDALRAKLIHNCLAVGLHGLIADMQKFSNLLSAVALSNHLQHLSLPSGEYGKGFLGGIGGASHKFLDYDIGYLRA